MRKLKRSTLLALLAILLLTIPVAAAFPDLIHLPTGFQPEGIAVGKGSTFYTGSLVDGAIFRGDLRTGEGSVWVEGQEGLLSVGLSFDERSNALFVSGGSTGQGRVYDGETGELLETYQLAESNSFINDVIVTREAAYFTNSLQPVLYKVPLGPGGSLPGPDAVEVLELKGDYRHIEGFNLNGIEAPSDGDWLIVVHSANGVLYRVNPNTGRAVEIDLDGASVSNGDGLLLRDSLLYVVRNRLNQIAVIDLSGDLTEGEVVDTITNPNFNVPTTLASFGSALYAVNAKFGVAEPASTPYEIVRVPLNDD